MTETPREPRQPRRTWVRAAVDRVPTSWFAAIGTAVFLAMTAAFGGLATAATPELPRLQAGDTHRGAQLSISIERAVLIDELREAGIYVEDGERVLALVVDVENVWDRPLSARDKSLESSLRVDGIDGAPQAIARLDDATQTPWLQPSVPVRVVAAWPVTTGSVSDGEVLSVTLSDLALVRGQFVVDGDFWSDPTPAAVVEVAVSDVGAGATE